MSAGRFAPSPSGDLHVGNLRTALIAWLDARSSDRSFVLRIEDLDRVRPGAEERQLRDLAAIGLDWDGPVARQSTRGPLYDEALRRLRDAEMVFECFCTRREILDAPSAPHDPPGAYPGTCRDLGEADRSRRRSERPAAWRLRSEVETFTVQDDLRGAVEARVDDFVLRRGDGVPAYNLAVVVDDAAQGIDRVVRGDDLLLSAPRQAYLATLLGLPVPAYLHVPLALAASGQRLAKRDGAVTLAELAAHDVDAFDLITRSLNLRGASPRDLLDSFDMSALPREPWIFDPPSGIH